VRFASSNVRNRCCHTHSSLSVPMNDSVTHSVPACAADRILGEGGFSSYSLGLVSKTPLRDKHDSASLAADWEHHSVIKSRVHRRLAPTAELRLHQRKLRIPRIGSHDTTPEIESPLRREDLFVWLQSATQPIARRSGSRLGGLGTLSTGVAARHRA